MSAAISPAGLVNDPNWLPNSLDMHSGDVGFVQIDRAGLVREAFLDDRMGGSITGSQKVPLRDLPTPLQNAPPPGFIFHSAFCCSTLLARALDAPGLRLTLKEPKIIMDIANARRLAKTAEDIAAVDHVRTVLIKLLARSHQGAERVIIKPTNTANNLAPAIAQEGTSLILVYGDLRSFLISILKKGEACKAFVRKQYTIFALDGEGVSAIPERQGLQLTDLQIAALVWRHQMEMFTRLLGAGNVRSLHYLQLLQRPLDVIREACIHLGTPADEDAIRAVANGPIFRTNSKFSNQQYDASVRAAEEAELLVRHHDELEMIEKWGLQTKLSAEIPMPLPSPLVS